MCLKLVVFKVGRLSVWLCWSHGRNSLCSTMLQSLEMVKARKARKARKVMKPLCSTALQSIGVGCPEWRVMLCHNRERNGCHRADGCPVYSAGAGLSKMGVKLKDIMLNVCPKYGEQVSKMVLVQCRTYRRRLSKMKERRVQDGCKTKTVVLRDSPTTRSRTAVRLVMLAAWAKQPLLSDSPKSWNGESEKSYETVVLNSTPKYRSVGCPKCFFVVPSVSDGAVQNEGAACPKWV
ncbi:MAG: hypothetical protein WCV67_10320 [Victivallaceae bacterium]|jgi:hypothetical protein